MKRKSARRSKWQDHYTRKAKKEQYPARSVYKLQEIQRKFKLIKKGDHVLDLGCAPGSWLKYAAELTGSAGLLVGIDLKPVTIALPPHVSAVTGDIFAIDGQLQDKIGTGFNVVLSDMAPATTGNKMTDAARSLELCQAALAAADSLLVAGGTFVCKIFQGEDFKTFSDQVKRRYQVCKIFKPQSSRKASKEVFVIGLQKRQEV